ncbi:MAG: hypothetical protein ACLR0Z_10055 [Gemmiger formicilis]|uniref:hypothetical protein n=1 Tax=Gemmiger formicilis TaxID=745368 RepID=UPI003A3C1194
MAAEPENGKITYNAGEGYTFEKISHPTKGTMSADGIVDYIGDGKVEVITDTNDSNYNAGDRGQSYSWSAIAYGDWLYVGTCYAAMGNTLTLMDGVLGDKFDKDVMEAALKAMFNNTFFYGQTKPDGTPDTDSEGILVKVNTKTGEMKLLLSKSMNDVAPMFRNAVAYKDKLYFCGSVHANGRSGLPSVYEIDPTDDSYKAVYVGLDSLQDYGAAYKAGVSTGIRGMCVYNDELVISNVYMNAATGESGALILASSNPSEGKSSFRTIATQADMFNYPAYRYTDSIYGGSVWDMAEYNGHLYVSICTGTPDNAPDSNTMQSFAIIRGDEKDDGTFNWTPLVGDKEKDKARYTFGIDPERTRSGAANLVVYNNKLYIGEYNDEEIALERILFNKTGDSADGSLGGVDCRFVNANLSQSVGLYAMDENENMTLIVGDATEMFPEGGVSGLGSGFGHNENQYIWRMQVYDGKLYVGTFDTSSLLEPIGQFSNGDIIGMTPEQWRQQMQLIKELLQLLMDKYGTSPIATIDENEEGEEVTSEIVDDAASNDEDEAFESDIAGLVDMMDMTPEVLEGDSTVTALCDEESVDNRENSLRDFADYYSNMLEGYNEISANYELPDDLKDAFETLLSQDKLDKINSVIECLIYMRDAERGFDMYVTEDGTNFTKLTTSGFGDPYNHGLRVFAITNQGLCLGTANPFYGTQLWIQRAEESETPSTPTPSTPTPSTPAPSTPTPSENPDITPAPGTEPSVTPAPTFTPAPTAVPTKAPVVTPAPAAAATAAKGIPQTSDSFPLPIVVLLLIGSAVAMGVMTFSYCRKKK